MGNWIKAIALAAGLPACVSTTHIPPAVQGQPQPSAPAWMQYGSGPVPASAARDLRRHLGPDADAYPGCAPETILEGYTLEHSGHLLDVCPNLSADHIGCHKGTGTAGVISVAEHIDLDTPLGRHVLAHEALHAWLACTSGSHDKAHDSPRFCALSLESGWHPVDSWGCADGVGR